VTVRFLEIAEIELDQAIQWYGAQTLGLGRAFLIEVLLPRTESVAFRRRDICWAKASAAAGSAGFPTG